MLCNNFKVVKAIKIRNSLLKTNNGELVSIIPDTFNNNNSKGIWTLIRWHKRWKVFKLFPLDDATYESY